MKYYNIEIGSKLELVSYVVRVEAKSKKEAIKKVKDKGLNCGKRLSSAYRGDFVVSYIEEIKPTEYNGLKVF